MKLSPALLAIAAIAASSSAFAQSADQSVSAPTPGAEAVAKADVANANNAAAAQAVQQSTMNAEEKARYEEDRAAYLAALRSHRREARMDARIYDRQQRAYADAMYVWRVQVADCKRGILKACNAPTPDPAAFW